MKNIDIRIYIKQKRIYMYEIAEALGMSQTAFSHRLASREFTDDEKEQVRQAVNNILAGD